MAARTNAEEMKPLFEKMLADGGITVRKLPEGVEFHTRSGEEGRFEFYLNCTVDAVKISGVNGFDMVSAGEVKDEITLPGYGVAVIRLPELFSRRIWYKREVSFCPCAGIDK